MAVSYFVKGLHSEPFNSSLRIPHSTGNTIWDGNQHLWSQVVAAVYLVSPIIMVVDCTFACNIRKK